MSVSVRDFGFTREGDPVHAYTITNAVGASCTLLDYGATVQSLILPNWHDGMTDVVLGYDTVAEYEAGKAFLGATIGRVGNRIGGARFSLGGKEHVLADNDGGNCLHGGARGFDRRMWQAEVIEPDAVRFSRLSPDGEENFPGNLQVSVTFTFTDDCSLAIAYDAVSDADTLVNLTNHSYFDLSGGGHAMDQTLYINASRYLELGAGTLPTGRQLSVANSPFDFRTPKRVGRDIKADDAQIRAGGGYDHNFCLSGPYAAMLESGETGLRLEVFTDMPGVQLYTANFLGDQPGKGGRQMHDRDGVCLETQLYPNAMNCYGFPSPILRAGQPMHSETVYSFSLIY